MSTRFLTDNRVIAVVVALLVMSSSYIAADLLERTANNAAEGAELKVRLSITEVNVAWMKSNCPPPLSYGSAPYIEKNQVHSDEVD